VQSLKNDLRLLSLFIFGGGKKENSKTGERLTVLPIRGKGEKGAWPWKGKE